MMEMQLYTNVDMLEKDHGPLYNMPSLVIVLIVKIIDGKIY